jgi:hypothetical protein
MKTCLMCWFVLVACWAISGARQSRNDDVMYSSSDGQVKYWLNCEFYGNDIENKPSTLGQCGSVCIANPDCIHFTWTNGMCYMKNTKDIDFRTRLDGAVCGFVKCRYFNCWFPFYLKKKNNLLFIYITYYCLVLNLIESNGVIINYNWWIYSREVVWLFLIEKSCPLDAIGKVIRIGSRFYIWNGFPCRRVSNLL